MNYIHPDTINELSLDSTYLNNKLKIYNINENILSTKNIDTYKKIKIPMAQLSIRKIIDNHFGKHDNPWCCFQQYNDREHKHFHELTYDSYYYWNEYTAVPKQLAFYCEKLVAFKCVSKEIVNILKNKQIDKIHDDIKFEVDIEKMLKYLTTDSTDYMCCIKQWWDKNNISHFGIPYTKYIENDKLHRYADFEYIINNNKEIQVGDFILKKQNREIHWNINNIFIGVL